MANAAPNISNEGKIRRPVRQDRTLSASCDECSPSASPVRAGRTAHTFSQVGSTVMSTQRVSIQNLPPLARIRNEPGRLVFFVKARQDAPGGRETKGLRPLKPARQTTFRWVASRISSKILVPAVTMRTALHPQAQHSSPAAARRVPHFRSANQPSFTKRAGGALCGRGRGGYVENAT